MSQLTEIAIVTKKLAIVFFLLVAGFIFLKFLFDLSVAYWKAAHPIPLYPPQMEFGKLPAPVFSQAATSSSGLQFKLENVEGLPIKDATSAAKVYPMPKKLPSLLAAQKARDFAAKFEFKEKEEPLSSTYYRFTDPDDRFHTLDVDINTMNFNLSYNYINNPSVLSQEGIPSKDQAIKEVKDFITYRNLFDSSILNGKITTTNLFYDTSAKTVNISSSLSNSNMIRINFFRSDIENRKILPPKFSESYNYALFTPSQNAKARILQLNYTFWNISPDDFGTYPIRSSENAWQDLLDGYALVINLGNNRTDQTITIRNIYLAYFDSEEPQSFLQPIYVFEGDNDFVAYLPAISPDWLE